ncbi:DNA topoisomerase VI subunit A [Encephalitozoon intestinalis ATCC 50506]|uniref:DNA topoisomerase (ATP-hydrolyzing) n=1 Tax=Encephalitozoon intestinalis (strain ATCC 50506) TaxID=876142 RepID=E0S6R3_ENCIT|nr:DNA topoisomerase VI subunit A [Encephalitozoon intestinalis ATCC 50506]ADM11398.1 DNA topoisomerase VI subunit A [Encephalitozoon intestinalis ATCC 50506]UTX45089.1 DNA topoisomerase VI subunit A [Encephalitozoon intestinalis]
MAFSSEISTSLKHNALKLLTELKSRTLVMRIRLHEIIMEMQELGITRNEREIFYMAVNIFKSQTAVKRLISTIASELRVSKSDLRIRNTLKGTFIGKLAFVKGPDIIEMSSCRNNPQLIPDMEGIVEVFCSYERVLVVEKDTILQRIASGIERERYLEGVLLVCGRGYPCKNTMLLLKMIEHKTAIGGLFDFDPFGIHIFCVYKYGSREAPETRVETIVRIGVCAEDILDKRIHQDGLAGLNKYDLKMVDRLMEFECFTNDPLLLKKTGKKVEMEAFLSKGRREMNHFLTKALKRI